MKKLLGRLILSCLFATEHGKDKTSTRKLLNDYQDANEGRFLVAHNRLKLIESDLLTKFDAAFAYIDRLDGLQKDSVKQLAADIKNQPDMLAAG